MCMHRLFYRRIGKKELKGRKIRRRAFKPRGDEDGIVNGPSVSWADLCSAEEALDGQCESDNRHLVAFRECSLPRGVCVECKDPDDPSHFFILLSDETRGYCLDPENPECLGRLTEWADHLAEESTLRIRCENRQIVETFDDPGVDCPHSRREGGS